MTIRDPYGMLIQGWQDRFTLWCRVHYLRGYEAVMQARLVSRAPVILTVRTSAKSKTVTSEWRAVIGNVTFDFKEDPRPSEDGGLLRCWLRRDLAAGVGAEMMLHSSGSVGCRTEGDTGPSKARGALSPISASGGGAQNQSAILPLVQYLDSLRWILIVMALRGIVVTIYARLDD